MRDQNDVQSSCDTRCIRPHAKFSWTSPRLQELVTSESADVDLVGDDGAREEGGRRHRRGLKRGQQQGCQQIA